MKKYSIGFILIEIAVMLVISIIPVVPVARKTMEKKAEKEGFVRSQTFYNRLGNTCASILAIDDANAKIAYVSVHNPFSFQTADVEDLTDVKSGYIKGPFDGTRYVYYQFTYNDRRIRIPTFTARSMHFLTAAVVQDAITKADSFRDSVQELQKKQMEEKRSKEVPFPSTSHIIKHIEDGEVTADSRRSDL